jgi:hypothetical protein
LSKKKSTQISVYIIHKISCRSLLERGLCLTRKRNSYSFEELYDEDDIEYKGEVNPGPTISVDIKNVTEANR